MDSSSSMIDCEIREGSATATGCQSGNHNISMYGEEQQQGEATAEDETCCCQQHVQHNKRQKKMEASTTATTAATIATTPLSASSLLSHRSRSYSLRIALFPPPPPLPHALLSSLKHGVNTVVSDGSAFFDSFEEGDAVYYRPKSIKETGKYGIVVTKRSDNAGAAMHNKNDNSNHNDISNNSNKKKKKKEHHKKTWVRFFRKQQHNSTTTATPTATATTNGGFLLQQEKVEEARSVSNKRLLPVFTTRGGEERLLIITDETHPFRQLAASHVALPLSFSLPSLQQHDHITTTRQPEKKKQHDKEEHSNKKETTTTTTTTTTTRDDAAAGSSKQQEGVSVLEIGCSTGETSATLWRHAGVQSWMGWDTSAEMIDKVQNKIMDLHSMNKNSNDNDKNNDTTAAAAAALPSSCHDPLRQQTRLVHRVDALRDPVAAYNILSAQPQAPQPPAPQPPVSTTLVDIGGNRSDADVLRLLTQFLWPAPATSQQSQSPPQHNNNSNSNNPLKECHQIIVKNRAWYRRLVAEMTTEPLNDDHSHGVVDADLLLFARRGEWVVEDGDAWLAEQAQKATCSPLDTADGQSATATTSMSLLGTWPKHAQKAPLRTVEQLQPDGSLKSVPICRYYNYHPKGCLKHARGACSLNHTHCHYCQREGHCAVDCPQRPRPASTTKKRSTQSP